MKDGLNISSDGTRKWYSEREFASSGRAPVEPPPVPTRVEDLRIGSTVLHGITGRPARLTGVVPLPAGSVRLEFQYAPPYVVWRSAVAMVTRPVQSST